MPNITLLPTITTVTNASTFVVIDNRLTRRINYQSFKNQLVTDLTAIGFKGDPGTPGLNGSTGTNGVGVVPGGTAGQVLAKIDEYDYNTEWVSISAVARTGQYSNLLNAPAPYTATSIDSFIDVDTTTIAPTNGQALVWSSTNSKWRPFTVGSGIGLSSRTSVQATTALSLLAGNTENCQVSGFKSYLLSKVTTTYPAWVRIYTDSASRTADATRSEGSDPLPGSGIIAEVITTSGNLTQLITPGVIGFNNDGVTTSTIYLAITNKDSIARVIGVTMNILQLES